MGTIQALPDALKSQIAAGEVVERPASVVKELVENALDAGATLIKVECDSGGLLRLSVTDNGSGMDREDALACLGRHATSKLRMVEDLQDLHTFGFRGEALPSIASVSRLSIWTRQKDADAGWHVRAEGGAPPVLEPCGTAVGTRVEVRDLFFNVPARRKFQKTTRTEATAVEETMTRMALSHPTVDITLLTDGREVLHAAPAHDAEGIRQRAESILGRNARGNLFTVEGALGDVTVRAHISNPVLSRGDSKGLFTFVNGRFVKDRTITHAVVESYRTLLEIGRQPVCILMLGVPPGAVDVNVHPQKLEVRFADGSSVHRAITHVLQPFLRTTPWLKTGERHYTVESLTPPTAGDLAEQHRDRTRAALERFSSHAGRSSAPLFVAPMPPRNAAEPDPPRRDSGPQTLPGLGGALHFSRLRPLGQVGLTYLLCEGPEGLVIVDQHAAHERVNFERLRNAVRAGQVDVQALLVPLRLSVTPAEEEALHRHAAFLAGMGFELSSLGPGDALLRTVPTLLHGKAPERVCRELLGELAESGARTPLDDAVDAVVARVACHGSVRAGDAMSPQEIRALLDKLDGIDLGAHCPHGRPVVRSLPMSTLAGWFDRT